MTPDSDLTPGETRRTLARIEVTIGALADRVDDFRVDVDRKLDAMRSQVVPRFEFEDHKRQAEAAMRDVRGDILDRLGKIEKSLGDAKKALGDRLGKLEDGTRLSVLDLITRLSPVIATVVVVIAAFQLRVG